MSGKTAKVKVKKNKKAKTTKKSSKKTKKKIYQVPETRYIAPDNYSLAKMGLEVYHTDEENYIPFIPSGSEKVVENIDSEDKQGFDLHLGAIKKTFYINELQSASFDSDYKDMSSSGSVKLNSIKPENIYKGLRVRLIGEWEKQGESLKWENYKEALLGFIVEQTLTEKGVEIKLSGMSKTLEQNYKFDFKSMKRSEIIRQVIKTAGLTPVIDVTGLDDDVTDFTNVSGDEDTNVDSGSATIDEVVKKAINGISDPLQKAKAIDKAFKSHVFYKYYFDCKYSDIEKAWNVGHLNCADGANVLCAMFNAGGLKAVIQHTPGEDGKGHYIVKVTINGKDYFTDNAANTGQHTSRAFGEVWGPKSGSTVGTKIGG